VQTPPELRSSATATAVSLEAEDDNYVTKGPNRMLKKGFEGVHVRVSRLATT